MSTEDEDPANLEDLVTKAYRAIDAYGKVNTLISCRRQAVLGIVTINEFTDGVFQVRLMVALDGTTHCVYQMPGYTTDQCYYNENLISMAIEEISKVMVLDDLASV